MWQSRSKLLIQNKGFKKVICTDKANWKKKYKNFTSKFIFKFIQINMHVLYSMCAHAVNKVNFKKEDCVPGQAVSPLWHPLLVSGPVSRLCSWTPITNQLWPSDSKTVSLAVAWLHPPSPSSSVPSSLLPCTLTLCQRTDRSSLQLSLSPSLPPFLQPGTDLPHHPNTHIYTCTYSKCTTVT